MVMYVMLEDFVIYKTLLVVMAASLARVSVARLARHTFGYERL